MVVSLDLPRAILTGGGSVGRLGGLLANFGMRRPLVVADSFLASPQSGAVDKVVAAMSTSVADYGVFTDTISDPTTESVERCVDALAAGSYDSIVALGGGSPMDTAKAAAALRTHGGRMRDYKAPFTLDRPSLPIVAIPTTAGTGSEATKFTIITDSETEEKMLCIGRAYLPLAAILDHELTLTKPLRLTADTGIDAICHAMEAYVSAKANPFSDGVAASAMRRLGGALHTACSSPADGAAREAMLLGSCEAGIAFSNSSVTLIHGMSRPLGASFHIPHGMCNAMLLPRVTAFSAGGAVKRYADAARLMGLCDEGAADIDAAMGIPDALQRVTSDLRVPTLEGFGIDEAVFRKAVPSMAQAALASGSPNNNPIVPTATEVEALYHEIWDVGVGLRARGEAAA
ncbi:hypothetical protein EMIHUDRAFT_437150 [Emiliania huxleyi CCMP1516]|uniref:Alcohol dehydrogenase 4 n=2 Tax=Emiliania huxleyi TaxID=2903 RepID=A0A0D3IP91_EMIH1|nr:hypothetical protein EMIHUDRAFT_437150 [Emiliania huxleyi CCMP1516]EOD13076.1 hypothetical protein EMIHUDRAFT_437150 [Emiliania huxleyi CCMP1516]|eukprot:XP_005765505.1 hypothetical protein EMIHUDRAFT_437150 [Emiliania huxleyi CCMP1516]